MANLNFTAAYTAPPSNDVKLNFGDIGQAAPKLTAALKIKIKAARFKANAAYDSSTSRPFVSNKKASWETEANSLKKVANIPWAYTSREIVEDRILWDRALRENALYLICSGELDRSPIGKKLPWEKAIPLNDRGVSSLHAILALENRADLIVWEEALRLSSKVSEAYKVLKRKDISTKLPWTEGFSKDRYWHIIWSLAKANLFRQLKLIPWEEARKVSSGIGYTPKPPIIPPYEPDYNLNFHCKFVTPNPLNVILNFGKDDCGGGSEIKDQEVYFIVNSVILKRLEDGVEIETISASIGIDSSSWCWSFSATIAYTEFAKIEPTEKGPVEVELEINGIKWRLLVEKYSTKEVLAKTDINISGRSLNAYLESPYAPVRSLIQDVAINSRQFAENELTRAGLVTGFDLNWQLIDPLGWLMPANTWSYTNLSPMQVITAIAGGAGGYVNVNPLANELLVLPEYPAPFWEWDGLTPDKRVPESLIKARSLTWEEKPLYNGVYASGEHTGVTAFIKRAGTAGDFQAPMYINPMISHSSAARQKGMSILSAGGKQAKVGIDVPMEKSLGLVQPGMMIEIQRDGAKKWRGLVRSTQISANFSSNGGLVVNQAIDIERHYGGF